MICLTTSGMNATNNLNINHFLLKIITQMKQKDGDFGTPDWGLLVAQSDLVTKPTLLIYTHYKI